MIYTAISYDCYYTIGRYSAEYRLIETYEANNVFY